MAQYNTAETLSMLGKKSQLTNKLKSYYATLKAYKSKIVQKASETDAEYAIRKNRLLGEHPELIKKMPKNLKGDDLIQEILRLEKQPSLGDLVSDINYQTLATKHKETGDILIGTEGAKKKRSQKYKKFSEDEQNILNQMLGIASQGKATQAMQAEQEKPQQVEQQASQQVEVKPVGSDPNTIQDVPKSRITKVKKSVIKDPIVFKGYAQRVRNLQGTAEEKKRLLTEYKDLLYSKMYSPKATKVNEEISMVDELLKKLEQATYKSRYPDYQSRNPAYENPLLTSPAVRIQEEATVIMDSQPNPTQIASIQASPDAEVKRAPQGFRGEPQAPQAMQAMQATQQAEPETPMMDFRTTHSLHRTAYDVLSGSSSKDKPIQATQQAEQTIQDTGDKNIGNVRQIGIGVYDELAKKDDVLPPLTEREKSLQRFANFKWIPKGGNNNSVLADLSPFQKIDDAEYNLRYSKTFKIKAKIPVLPSKYMAKICDKFFDTQYIPNSKIMGIAQPSTPIGFADSQSNLVRNVLINEKEFDKPSNMSFLPSYSDKPKRGNPFSACNGLESYFPNKPIMPPVLDPLQKPSVIVHPDTNSLMYV